MPETTRQGLYAKHVLTAHEMADLEQLVTLCQAREHLLLRLDYNVLNLSNLPTDDLFLYYRANQLIGCLLMDRYHSSMKEVAGLVHPDFRRQGIFSALLVAASQECLSRGITRLLFACESTSTSGRAFLHAIGAGREFAEHRMVLETFRPRLEHDERLTLREARRADGGELAVVLTADFDGDREMALRHVLHTFERPNQRIYLATYHGARGRSEPVGAVCVDETPQELGIYGFFVHPAYRGHGYGRQVLEQLICMLLQAGQKPITLEVDANNFTALNLYRSLGFAIEHTYEYYELTLN